MKKRKSNMITNLRDLIKRLEQFTSDEHNPTGDDSPVVVVSDEDRSIQNIERDLDGVITIYCS